MATDQNGVVPIMVEFARWLTNDSREAAMALGLLDRMLEVYHHDPLRERLDRVRPDLAPAEGGPTEQL